MDANQGCGNEGDNDLQSQEDSPWMTSENKREKIGPDFQLEQLGRWLSVSGQGIQKRDHILDSEKKRTVLVLNIMG